MTFQLQWLNRVPKDEGKPVLIYRRKQGKGLILETSTSRTKRRGINGIEEALEDIRDSYLSTSHIVRPVWDNECQKLDLISIDTVFTQTFFHSIFLSSLFSSLPVGSGTICCPVITLPMSQLHVTSLMGLLIRFLAFITMKFQCTRSGND